MVRKFIVFALGVALLCVNATAQDARAVIANATKAIGAENLTAITYSGTAADIQFQQSRYINLPLRPITNYVRAIDLNAPASRQTGNTNNPPGGPQTGPPAPGLLNQAVTAQQAVLTQAWNGQVELWITPWGFLKGAASNNATARMAKVGGKNYTVLSWSPAVKAPSGASYVINGYINDQNMIEKVETWLQDTVMGDMRIEATYTEWKDFGGVKAPAKIVQKRGELPYFEANITAAKANPTDIAALIAGPPPPARGAGGAGAPPAGGAPAAGRGAAPPAGAQGGRGAAVPPVPGGAPPAAAGGGGGGRGAAAPITSTSEKMADGVYRIMGGYVSLAVEFDDYIMVLEGPESDARAISTIAETKKLIPNKPIRYVFNTHPHSDHSGGLGAFVAEGATIITHQNNKKFFEDAFSTPRTLLPTTDTLAKAQADAKAKGQMVKVKVEGVGDKKVYKDSKHSVELYYMKTNLGAKKVPDYTPHSEGWMLAYLPKEKILFQGDFTVTPGAAMQNDHVMQVFVPNVLDRLKLDFEKDVPVHPGNPNVALTRAEVLKAVGR